MFVSSRHKLRKSMFPVSLLAQWLSLFRKRTLEHFLIYSILTTAPCCWKTRSYVFFDASITPYCTRGSHHHCRIPSPIRPPVRSRSPQITVENRRVSKVILNKGMLTRPLWKKHELSALPISSSRCFNLWGRSQEISQWKIDITQETK